MNQILVTKKLYITPELKKKKKIYKFDFILSVFLVIVLISIYIYAEYDKNKSEEVSQEILAQMETQLNKQEDKTTAKSNVLVAILNSEETEEELPETQETPVQPQEPPKEQTTTNDNQGIPKQKSPGGYLYATDAIIEIPKIGIKYSVILGEKGDIPEIEDLLKISPVKFHGGNPNEVGNYCIVGHNYRNKRFFSKVPTLQNGDIINITDMSNRTISYAVYDKYEVVPEDTSCTSQLTNGKKEITLITCTDDSKLRVIVKAREVK